MCTLLQRSSKPLSASLLSLTSCCQGLQPAQPYDMLLTLALAMHTGDLPFLSPAFLSLGLYRVALVRTILGYGFDVVVSDTDTGEHYKLRNVRLQLQCPVLSN